MRNLSSSTDGECENVSWSLRLYLSQYPKCHDLKALIPIVCNGSRTKINWTHPSTNRTKQRDTQDLCDWERIFFFPTFMDDNQSM